MLAGHVMSKKGTSNESVNKLVNAITQSAGRNGRRNRNRRYRRRRITRRRFRNSRGPDGILAGYGSSLTSVFDSRRTQDGLIVSGMDLVTSFQLGSNISYFMTANPAAWNGTRIAAIAGGFQNYRPLKFRIHYRPQTGSTSSTSVFIGTIWQNNYLTSRSQIEPSLLTSPGGVYTPAWQSSVSTVRLGNCLPQRMFPIRDPSFETVPFAVVARASNGGPGDVSVEFPGRIFIEYSYEFRNAVGSGSGFQPSTVNSQQWTASEDGLVTTDSGGTGWVIDYSAAPNNNHPLFAKVTLDVNNNGAYVVKMNGQLLSLPSGTSFRAYLYSDNGLPA